MKRHFPHGLLYQMETNSAPRIYLAVTDTNHNNVPNVPQVVSLLEKLINEVDRT
jgi:hypothetical protein